MLHCLPPPPFYNIHDISKAGYFQHWFKFSAVNAKVRQPFAPCGLRETCKLSERRKEASDDYQKSDQIAEESIFARLIISPTQTVTVVSSAPHGSN